MFLNILMWHNVKFYLNKAFSAQPDVKPGKMRQVGTDNIRPTRIILQKDWAGCEVLETVSHTVPGPADLRLGWKVGFVILHNSTGWLYFILLVLV